MADRGSINIETYLIQMDTTEVERAAGRGAAAVEKMGRTIQQTAAVAGSQGTRGFQNMGMSVLYVSQAVEDLQYGFRSIVNNIPQIAMAFGAGAGLAGAVSLAAVGVNVLVNNLDRWTGAADRAKEAQRRLNAETERTSRVAAMLGGDAIRDQDARELPGLVQGVFDRRDGNVVAQRLQQLMTRDLTMQEQLEIGQLRRRRADADPADANFRDRMTARIDEITQRPFREAKRAAEDLMMASKTNRDALMRMVGIFERSPDKADRDISSDLYTISPIFRQNQRMEKASQGLAKAAAGLVDQLDDMQQTIWKLDKAIEDRTKQIDETFRARMDRNRNAQADRVGGMVGETLTGLMMQAEMMGGADPRAFIGSRDQNGQLIRTLGQARRYRAFLGDERAVDEAMAGQMAMTLLRTGAARSPQQAFAMAGRVVNDARNNVQERMEDAAIKNTLAVENLTRQLRQGVPARVN